MIGAASYFAPRMFAPTYWPKTGADSVGAPNPIPPLYAILADDGRRRASITDDGQRRVEV